MRQAVEEIGQLVAGLEGFVRHYGAFAVMPILAIEAVGAPVPGESLLIFASVLAGRGEMSLPSLLIFAWGGSVVGDNLGYLVGRKVGRGTILRYGAKVGLTDERVKGIERVYVRYGSATVLFARFFSILRQLNGIVAGMLGMSWWRFVLLDASRCSALGNDLGVRSCLFQRAPDFHCRAGPSHQGGREFSARNWSYACTWPFHPAPTRCGLDNAAMSAGDRTSASAGYSHERLCA